MNHALQELLDISANELLTHVEKDANVSWVPNPLESQDTFTKKEVLIVSEAMDIYKQQVQKGYEIIIEQLEKELEK